jgi:FAD/FMN-containing dehydrogenase
VKDLARIVGEDRLVDDPETIRSYARDESFATPTRPRCVVRPRTAEQVQEVVRWAASAATPLVPVSSGPPRFRGDSVPAEGGAVVVDLSGMKAIPRVDRRNRVAMIEPGVTFGELIPALAAEGLAPYLPLAPRATKSVVASMLEREPLTAPRHHWDAQDPLLCLEVVFGTGDVFRTGSAAGPGTLEEQRKAGGAQMRGMGPGQTDLQRIVQGAQGTMGIVTWTTLKCRLLPAARDALLVGSDALEPLVALAAEALRVPIGDDLLILDAAALASLLAPDAGQALALRRELPPWVLYFGADGTGVLPAERIEYQIADLRRLAQKEGLAPARTLRGPVRAGAVAAVLTAPCADPYWKLRSKGACEDVFFLTTLDRAPQMARRSRELADRAGYPAADAGVYLQPTVQGTSCHCELILPYARENEAEVRAVRRLVEHESAALMEAGGFFSRPYGAWADAAFRRDAATAMVLRKVKDVFDPHGILNPGKLCL